MARRDEKILADCYAQAASYISFGYESIEFILEIAADRSATITRRIAILAQGEVKQLDQYLLVPVLRQPHQPNAMQLAVKKAHRTKAEINHRTVQSHDGKKTILVLDIDPPLLKGNRLEYEIVESMVPGSLALLQEELEPNETENKFSFEVSWPTRHLSIQVLLPQSFAPTRLTADVWRGQTRVTVDEVAKDMRDKLQEDESFEDHGQKHYKLWLDVPYPTQGFVYALKWVPPPGTSSDMRSLVSFESRKGEPIQTTTKITWLHISDLHYRDSQSYQIERMEKSLFKDIKGMIDDKGLAPDFIVFTGDLAFSAQPDQYKWVERFLDRLLIACSLSERNRVFTIPGNHDVDRGRIDDITAIGSLKHLTSDETVTELLGPNGSRSRSAVFAKFGPYWDFFNSYFAGLARSDPNDYFWTRRMRIGQHVVGLIGLNSAWMSGFNKNQSGQVSDEGALIVGERQVYEALERIDGDGGADLLIALQHHPLDNLNDAFDKLSVQSLLRRRCDFLLHGHLHHPDVIHISALDGETCIIPAGACYDRPSLPTGFNLVQLDLKTIERDQVKEGGEVVGKAVLRRYSKRQEEWIPDIDATGEKSMGEWPIKFPLRSLRS